MSLALVSVSDKTGLEELVQTFKKHSISVLSTGGTAKRLKELGAEVTLVEDYTGFPESPDGLVKSLHPKIHFGISLNGSIAYDDYLGQANITSSDWYGIPEYNDPLIYGYYLGVIFVPYEIVNAKVYKGTELIATANGVFSNVGVNILISGRWK